MVTTETKPPPKTPQEKRDLSFSHLTNTLKRYGQPAHQAVAGYIRLKTGGKITNLARHHAAGDISDEDKFETYKFCFNALVKKGGPDYEVLKATLQNDAYGDIGAVTDEEAPKVARKRSTVPVEASEDVPVVETHEVRDPLTKAILDVVMPHLKDLKVKSGTDEARVEEITREICAEFRSEDEQAFHDKVAKALTNGAFPTDRVETMLKKLKGELMEGMVTWVQLIKPDGTVKAVEGIVHEKFPVLVQMAQARSVNVLLVGPTGSGKTHGAEQLSKALELPFYFNGAIDTEYKLKGFIDANGNVINPAFRKAYENGGVYLFDEVDASLPPAVLAFNAALSNHICDFPDGKVDRHKDCIIIAAGNTWLGGGTFDYVGRMKQDAAFADRFATLYWNIDEKMEMAVAGDKDWCKYVQQLRGNVVKHGLKVIISPRATFLGEKLLAAGVEREQVIASVVRKGMTSEQWQQIGGK